jgi:hypothetical protein
MPAITKKRAAARLASDGASPSLEEMAARRRSRRLASKFVDDVSQTQPRPRPQRRRAIFSNAREDSKDDEDDDCVLAGTNGDSDGEYKEEKDARSLSSCSFSSFSRSSSSSSDCEGGSRRSKSKKKMEGEERIDRLRPEGENVVADMWKSLESEDADRRSLGTWILLTGSRMFGELLMARENGETAEEKKATWRRLRDRVAIDNSKTFRDSPHAAAREGYIKTLTAELKVRTDTLNWGPEEFERIYFGK